MNTWIVVFVAAVISTLVALWQRNTLASLSYRYPDETTLPHPGPRNWVTLITITAAISITATNQWQYWPTYAPLILAGGWLAAVDLDVHRLPNKVLLPVGACTTAGAITTAAITQNWITLPAAAIAATVIFAVFAILSKGIGAGDAKLATIIGLALGVHSPILPLIAIIIGSLATIAWVQFVHKQRPFPYGPGLLYGAWTATLIPAL
jgi:leader peptidase (prepilin peptidase)/N-methyltransferase